jgi:hypothetical protein
MVTTELGYCLACGNTHEKGWNCQTVEQRRDPLLVEREKTHGSFEVHARITQGLKEEMEDEPTFEKLSDRHKESLHMIVHKIGRILAGNSNFKDHWDDIAGYAKLGSEACE